MDIACLALQRDKYRHLSDDEWRWFLQQEDGRQRTADKLPTFAATEDWWYPVRLSCEQCSSELTARYKAQIVNGKGPNGKCLDLTAGYGVDTYFLSERFEKTDYVERDAELCRIAEHNFQAKIQQHELAVHNTTAEEFLTSAGLYDLIFLDPARRDSHGGKVFRLEECTPDVTALLPTLLRHLTPEGRILLKLSPMLDITQALHALSALTWDVHVVAVKNEVKEVLLLSGGTGIISAIDLAEPEKTFVFTREEERDCPFTFHRSPISFIYEPNTAILKAGAYKLAAARYGLHLLDANTHLYASDTFDASFPGRVWQVKAGADPKGLKQANVVVRNYPLTTEQLKKKLRIRDGGDDYLIGCRIAGKPTLLVAERIR